MPKLILTAPDHPLSASIGGQPLAPPGTLWPICRQCAGPMQFLAQLPIAEADSPELSGRDEMLLLFQCQNDPGLCEEWDANGGGNAALLVPTVTRQLLPAPDGETLLPQEYKLRFVPFEESLDASTAHEAYLAALLAHEPSMLGKTGGQPVWFQFDQTPKCSCGQPMTFVGQIEEVGTEINFGGGGVGYAFVCAACPATARFLWQC